MSNPIFWTNVGVDVQTSLATAITITNISKAATGVVAYTGATDPANGDYITLTSNGMAEVGDRVFRIASVNATANTFELEGEDTTDYQTFVSGSFQVITFGASMTTAQTINVSGGETEYADVTTIHDMVKKRVPTIVSPLSMTMDNLFDLTDPAYIELNKAHKSKTKRAIRLRFGTGAKMALTGYASAAGVPMGQAQGVVQMKIAIEAQNLPTVYAS